MGTGETDGAKLRVSRETNSRRALAWVCQAVAKGMEAQSPRQGAGTHFFSELVNRQ